VKLVRLVGFIIKKKMEGEVSSILHIQSRGVADFHLYNSRLHSEKEP
jgi:hypothetical protein